VVVDGGFGGSLLVRMIVTGCCLISHSPNYNISGSPFREGTHSSNPKQAF